MAKLSGAALVFAVGPTTRSTTEKLPIGTRASDTDGNQYIYIKAEGAIAVGAPVSVSNGIREAFSSTDVKGFIGVVQGTAFADEEYGFILSRGRGLALVPSGVALGDPVTAGNGALSATLTSAVKFATVQEAPVLLSGTTQLKYVWLH